MLVAISGSQGSGKSTILDKLAQSGYNTVTRKTSRSILTDWGVSLADVNGNHRLTQDFQDEVIARKRIDEQQALQSNELWFTERTYADLFAYSLITLGKDNSYSEWLNQYYNNCLKLSQSYAAVYYLSAGHFVVEHDGVRGANVHYSRMVDCTMLDITRQMVHNSRLTVVHTPDLNTRANMIAEQSKSL